MAIVSLLLVNGARDQLFRDAGSKQQRFATDASRLVDSYLDSNTGQLAFVARLYATDPTHIDQSLTTLLRENRGMQKVEVLTVDGKRRAATTQDDETRITVTKIRSDDTTFDQLAGKARLITLKRDTGGTPELAIALPIFNDQQSGSTNKLIGGIIGHFKVGDAWESLLPHSQAADDYAYVVDGSGNLVHHPDRNFLSSHHTANDIEAVRNFLAGSYETRQTKSAENDDVISTAHLTKSGWGVIIEEPTASVYAGMRSFTQLAAVAIFGALVVSVITALFFSMRIVRPIKRLVVGARSFSQNKLTQRIDIKTKDELQEVADVLSDMGTNVSHLVSDLESNNRDLTSEQSKLQNIINSVNDGVVAINAKQEIVSINRSAARLLTNITHPVVGRPLQETLPWTHEGEPLKIETEYPGFRQYENIVLAKGESVSYLDLTVEVLDRDDNNVAAIITIHDQTASRELNFLKLDFVAIAAHELRTPLSVISGYLDMLDREAIKELSNENIENLRSAIVGAGQLRELINKLLNIARIERGDMEIFLDKIDLAALTAKNVQEHQPVATQRGHTLRFVSDSHDAVYVPADTASIVEVLNNLIGNAVKYTPDGGQIQVAVTANDNEARVEVTDNGPGVPEELRDKLFSKFYRAERNMIANTRGTGLGLFISKTVIELQHGTIGIAPDQGHGSTFYFTLPIYKPERDDALIQKNISRGKHGWYKKSPNS
jgi:signal transduction histidine kinase